ncbi:MAG TPA: uroporphyrinogen-III C-methyltransferase [Candidatus Omnitrophota bacterium]|nr:uroporphyrinogen-III C-methyltransferase [Candidatus Omnitrophota bacterium]
MNFSIRIGSRSSRLALAQVEEILRLVGAYGHTPLQYELITFKTQGDKDKTTPLTRQPGDDFFTDTLDQALLEGSIDIAVHSAKDLPQHIPVGLEIFALTKTLDDRDAWVGPCAFTDLPKGAKVGTSSVLRQKQIKELRPDVDVVDIRGTIEERMELVKQGKVDGIVVAACALKRLGLEKKIKDIFPWEGMALQGQLAVVGRAKDTALRNLFKVLDVRTRYGKVILAGAGPGDPDLVTVKAIKALKKADCVFYDYLADTRLLNYAPQAEHIYAGKRKGKHTFSQEALSRMLKEKAMAGKNVVRLKGGDPLIFGRGADEITYLRSYHVPVSVIPGISSATGIPADLMVPLTARGIASSVAFISGHEEGEGATYTKPIAIPKADTIIFLMGLTKLDMIAASLKKAKWPDTTPIMIISKGTRPDERIVKGTLANIETTAKKSGLKPPALIIAGATVDFYQDVPGKNILYLGTNPSHYRKFGTIIHWPVIDIKPVIFDGKQRNKLEKDLARADLVVVTSRFGVECFMKILKGETFAGKKFAAVGAHTADCLLEHGIIPFVVAKEETAQGLLKALLGVMDVKGKHVLFPRSSLPNPFLKDALTKKGAKILEWTIYENVKPPKRDLPDISIDQVIFTSPSTVKNFLTDYGTIPAHWDILAKGPVTARALKEAGYQPTTLLT